MAPLRHHLVGALLLLLIIFGEFANAARTEGAHGKPSSKAKHSHGKPSSKPKPHSHKLPAHGKSPSHAKAPAHGKPAPSHGHAKPSPPPVRPKGSSSIFSVWDYGAVADGKTDNSKAFQSAWAAACQAPGRPTLTIPKGSYVVGPLSFQGPCEGYVTVELIGQLLASTNLKKYKNNWVEFRNIHGLMIHNGGTLDGQGAKAWPHNHCRKSSRCKTLPQSLLLDGVTDAIINGIHSVNSMFFHMNIYKSKNIQIQSVTIKAPQDSPNTDGIHIGDSTNVNITDATIATGDDCISIGPGNANVTVSRVTCGPGHGISIGSLGKYPKEGDVRHVVVTNCTLVGTMNGVRVKSWEDTPSPLKASDILFNDIVMDNVVHPIIIDQKYCPNHNCAPKKPSQVKIENIRFEKIRGTCSGAEAIQIVCSGKVPCEGVHLKDIDLKPSGKKRALTGTCVNVHGTTNVNVNPGVACVH